jgi:hypothetical protein
MYLNSEQAYGHYFRLGTGGGCCCFRLTARCSATPVSPFCPPFFSLFIAFSPFFSISDRTGGCLFFAERLRRLVTDGDGEHDLVRPSSWRTQQPHRHRPLNITRITGHNVRRRHRPNTIHKTHYAAMSQSLSIDLNAIASLSSTALQSKLAPIVLPANHPRARFSNWARTFDCLPGLGEIRSLPRLESHIQVN